jgi:hypothetical protein
VGGGGGGVICSFVALNELDILCHFLHPYVCVCAGGHAWPDDRQDEITRYTMVLEFEVRPGERVGGWGRE